MKKMILAAIAALSLGGLTAASAIAQPPGHDMRGDMRHDGDRDRDRDRDSDRGHNWNNRHDNGRHYGWERGRHRGWDHNRRVSCRWIWRHHHRQRVCFRR
jgi:Ni/Co efflux regulator RcnB